eukprot:751462-Prorocentrum_minimum.AAC.1
MSSVETGLRRRSTWVRAWQVELLARVARADPRVALRAAALSSLRWILRSTALTAERGAVHVPMAAIAAHVLAHATGANPRSCKVVHN